MNQMFVPCPNDAQLRAIKARPVVFHTVKVHLYDETCWHVVVATSGEAAEEARLDHVQYLKEAADV